MKPASPLGWPALLLVALAVVVYANADHELFLFDSKHIVQVEQTGGGLGALRDFWDGRLNPDAPLTFLTFAWNRSLNRALGLEGLEVTTFLLVNVLLHAFNALLLLLLIRRLLQEGGDGISAQSWIPFGLAALFLVHPLHASSVAYIIQRRGLLATTFYLLGVLAFLRLRGSHVVSGAAVGGITADSPRRAEGWTWSRLLWLAAIPGCYWLSLRSKNLGMTLPLTVLVIELGLRAREGVPLKKTLALLLGVLLLSGSAILVFLGKRGYFDADTFAVGYFGPEPSWGPWEHLLTEARVFVHYWKLLLLPLPRWSSIDHDFALSRHLLDQMAGVAVVFHLLLLAVAVYAATRRRYLIAIGIGWFYVALIPYAFLPQRELFAEYKTYLPSIGLFLVLTGALLELRHRVAVRLQIAALALLVAGSLAVTVRRNVIYQCRVHLWTDAVQKAPAKWRPRYNLGAGLTEEGRYAEAADQYLEAIRLEPELHPAHSNLAGVLVKQGRLEDAIAHYREVVRLQPEWPMAHYRLANTLAEAGHTDEALEQYSRALALAPDLAEAHANLGVVLARQGRLGEAIEHLRTAASLRPNSAPLHRELRSLLLRQSQQRSAERPEPSGQDDSDSLRSRTTPPSSAPD